MSYPWLDEIRQRQNSAQDYPIGTTPQILIHEDLPLLEASVRRLILFVEGVAYDGDAAIMREEAKKILEQFKEKPPF